MIVALSPGKVCTAFPEEGALNFRKRCSIEPEYSVYVIKQFKFWRYLQGNFLYRVHWSKLRKAVKVIIVVVLGALLPAALTLIFNDTVILRIMREIEGLFN